MVSIPTSAAVAASFGPTPGSVVSGASKAEGRGERTGAASSAARSTGAPPKARGGAAPASCASAAGRVVTALMAQGYAGAQMATARGRRRGAAVAAVGLLDPPRRPGVGQLVGELGRGHQGGEERGGRQVGDGEGLADQMVELAELALQPVHRGHGLAPRLLAAADAVDQITADGRPDQGKGRPLDEPRRRAEPLRSDCDRGPRVLEQGVERGPADAGAELFVEEVLERESPLPVGRAGRVERRVGPVLLERGDDPGRVSDRPPVDLEDRRGSPFPLEAPPQPVRARRERAALVGDPLEVERPAGLLVVVGEAELPEDGQASGVAHCAASSHHQLGCPPSWISSSTPSGACESRSSRPIGALAPAISVTISAPSASRRIVAARVEPAPPQATISPSAKPSASPRTKRPCGSSRAAGATPPVEISPSATPRRSAFSSTAASGSSSTRVSSPACCEVEGRTRAGFSESSQARSAARITLGELGSTRTSSAGTAWMPASSS